MDIGNISRDESEENMDLLTDDINDLPMTTEEIEETSNYLKILRWQVRFNQNPDMEDEKLVFKHVRKIGLPKIFVLQLLPLLQSGSSAL